MLKFENLTEKYTYNYPVPVRLYYRTEVHTTEIRLQKRQIGMKTVYTISRFVKKRET